jgi:predicted peptidase
MRNESVDVRKIKMSTCSFVIMVVAVVAVLTTGCVAGRTVTAGPSESTVTRMSYHSEFLGTDRDYWLYLPKGYDKDVEKEWPVILFLHGGGERGDDAEKVLKHGPIKEVFSENRDLPFIILAPQMRAMPETPDRERKNRSRGQRPKVQPTSMVRQPTDEEPRWGSLGPPYGWHELDKDLLLILDRALAEHRADPDRVYLTGLSYGGFGTWYMATNYPDRWAAAVPICGAGQPEEVHKIGKLPVWLFQGGNDNVVLPEWSIATADALEESGGDVRVTVHEDLGHDCWTRVYEGEDIYNWMLSHKRGETKD